MCSARFCRKGRFGGDGEGFPQMYDRESMMKLFADMKAKEPGHTVPGPPSAGDGGGAEEGKTEL